MIDKPINNRAWFFVLPVLAFVLFSSIIPVMTVVNYSLQDTLGENNFFWNGDSWFRDLLNPATTIGALMQFCFGYVDAITDSLLENRRLGAPDICVPDGLDDTQLREIVVKFLKENYRLRPLAAPALVAQALTEAYPCR